MRQEIVATLGIWESDHGRWRSELTREDSGWYVLKSFRDQQLIGATHMRPGLSDSEAMDYARERVKIDVPTRMYEIGGHVEPTETTK